MTAKNARPLLRLQTYDDVLGAIPHLIGFHPAESLVVLVMVQGELRLTARLDLSDAAWPDGVEGVLTRIWSRFPTADAWFVAYTAHREYGWAVLRRCDAFLPSPAHRRLIVVGQGTWQAQNPSGPRGVHDPSCTRTAAAATLYGLVARPSRADVATLLDPPPAADVGRLTAVAHRVGAELATAPIAAWPRMMARAIDRFDTDGDLDDDAAARLAALAADPAARAVALLTMSAEHADQQIALWRGVVTRTLAVHQGYPLVLLGMAAWIAGEGALVSICLERVDQLLPPTDLVGTLHELVLGVVPPSRWDELRPELLAEASDDVRRAVLRPVVAR